MSDIALGTAQIGMDYGVNNQTRFSGDNSKAILALAKTFGISYIDTAKSYGVAEKLIGEAIDEQKWKVNVVTKLKKLEGSNLESEIDRQIMDSCQTLNQSVIEGVMVHDFSQIITYPELLRVLSDIKAKGRILSVGVSLYEIEQLDYLMNQERGIVDFIQVPYSMLDRSFESYFSKLEELGILCDIRSVFLQGLIFQEHDKMTEENRFYIRQYLEIAKRHDMSLYELALRFVCANDYVRRIVVGVDNTKQLEDLFQLYAKVSLDKAFNKYIHEVIEREIHELPKQMTDPRRW